MCHVLIEDVTRCLLAYNIAEAGKRLYEFIWDELADWYVPDTPPHTSIHPCVCVLALRHLSQVCGHIKSQAAAA